MGDEVVEINTLKLICRWVKRIFRIKVKDDLDQDVKDAMCLFLPGTPVRHEEPVYGDGVVLEFHPTNKYRNVKVQWVRPSGAMVIGVHSFRKLTIVGQV